MSYTINNKPLEYWGLRAGTIGSAIRGYALKGAWTMPKRLGETHHDWQGDLEPYVDADDIHFDGRDLELSLICKAKSPAELQAKLSAFEDAMPDNFTLAHPILGSYQVGLASADITTYGGQWGAVVLKLREPNPTIGVSLPAPDGGAYGIDGYSWGQLGFVVSAIDNRHGIAAWKPLNVTANPMSDNWLAGYRNVQTVTISGTIKGTTYNDFKSKVDTLQALISAPGLRVIRYFDGSVFNAFCVDGFDVEVIKSGNSHWGQLDCKMTTI